MAKNLLRTVTSVFTISPIEQSLYSVLSKSFSRKCSYIAL